MRSLRLKHPHRGLSVAFMYSVAKPFSVGLLHPYFEAVTPRKICYFRVFPYRRPVQFPNCASPVPFNLVIFFNRPEFRIARRPLCPYWSAAFLSRTLPLLLTATCLNASPSKESTGPQAPFSSALSPFPSPPCRPISGTSAWTGSR